MKKGAVALFCSLILFFAVLASVFAITTACADTDTEIHTHTWEEATCSTLKTCSSCGATESDSLVEHKYEPTNIVESTSCLQCGYTEYTCIWCNDSYQIYDWIYAPHTWGDWEVLSAPSCTAEGDNIRYCSLCNKKDKAYTSPLGHSIVVDNAIAPTCTYSGLTEGSHCTTCDKIATD